MKSRPILFSAPMVRAIIAGTKTQTRRIIKPQPKCREITWGCIGGQGFGFIDGDRIFTPPYGKLLWVKETWKPDPSWGQSNSPTMEIQEGSNILFRSTLPEFHPKHAFGKWRPSIFMRRWMSRITLAVENVRVERLQDISEEDAKAEGAIEKKGTHGSLWRHGDIWEGTPQESYKTLWDSINAKDPAAAIRGDAHPWDSNPWVWVITFRRK